VRQLNFYGFRKIKNDPIKVTDIENSHNPKHWHFRHEKFLRDRPDLLVEIKKANQTPGPGQEEVDALKAEVKSLREQVSSMKECMDNFTWLLEELRDGRDSSNLESRKRKQDNPNSPSDSLLCVPMASVLPVDTSNKKMRSTSASSNATHDTEMMKEIFSDSFSTDLDYEIALLEDFDKRDCVLEEAQLGTEENTTLNIRSSSLESQKKLSQALSSLPQDLQQSFMDWSTKVIKELKEQGCESPKGL